MPVIVVTRLRLRDPALLDEFFTDAVAAIEQAAKSEGNLGADALADANNAWWSVSAWQERRLMRAFVGSEPHLTIRARLDHYCDEATFVDWEQPSADLPDWQTSWRHLTADGKAAELTHASAANQSLDFPPPVEPPTGVSGLFGPVVSSPGARVVPDAHPAAGLRVDEHFGRRPCAVVAGCLPAAVIPVPAEEGDDDPRDHDRDEDPVDGAHDSLHLMTRAVP
jgi:hypothetical protein